jgi:hypothetical protein
LSLLLLLPPLLLLLSALLVPPLLPLSARPAPVAQTDESFAFCALPVLPIGKAGVVKSGLYSRSRARRRL